MSTVPELDIDLEKLFLPAWAQESAAANRYAHFAGGERESQERRRDFKPGRRPPNRDRREQPRGERPRDHDRGKQPGFKRGERPARWAEPDRREPAETLSLPDVNASLVPDENGVESLARQIRTTGRAYPLFGIAQIILQKPERFAIRFSVKKKEDGQPVQPLFVCALDDTLWLSEDEVVAHVLKNHFATFYQTERTATEPPKGTYTFVAQCGMSGVILGPPNHHDYQNQLRKLHAEKFARMPFDVFKSRVKIVRDEAVVKKWIDEQSWKTDYVCLNVPEPLKLPDMDEVEKHFRSVHKEAIVKPVDSHTLSGVAARGMRCQGLSRLARKSVEDQRRFPLQIATVLSQQFGSRNLQFFKVNKTLTHVSVARPHYLDMEMTPVSDGIKRIVDFINSQSKCTRRKLVEALAPAPQPAQPAPAAAAQGPEGSPSPAPTPEPTPEQTAVIADLHWLIHQGHVIEFANGFIETAKRPVPKPPKPETKAPKPAAEPPAAIGGTETVAVNNAATPAAEAEEMPSSEPAASDSAKALEGPVSETASEEATTSSAAPVETDEQRVLQPEAESPAQSEKPSEADADESADKPASQPPAP